MKKAIIAFVLILTVFISCTVNKNVESTANFIQDEQYIYGINVQGMQVVQGSTGEQETINTILAANNLPIISGEISKYNLKEGTPYTLIADSAHAVQYFIYETTKLHYVVVDLTDKENIATYREQKEVVENDQVASFTISEKILDLVYNTENDSTIALLADVFDYYNLQNGDTISVAYSQKLAGEALLNISRIKAIRVENRVEEHYAILYEEDGKLNYFTEEGKNVKPKFAKAPLDYKRISSRFSLTRKHPVTKRVKPHYGTDYAAPMGTPIWSTSDGVVAGIGRSRGNGNYIIIKHDETYSTQYLHMSKFAKGIKRGKKVMQGEVIGYVGKTGMASGPHLCYRFWVNGIQVDPLKEKEHLHEKLTAEKLEEFAKVQQELKMSFRS